MSNVGSEGRSYQRILFEDLKKLAGIAIRDREQFFRHNPKWAELYAQRVICIALCQGAAQHYIDTAVGINDFDVYTFYRRHPDKPWYAKRIKCYDFGDAKFGQSIDRPEFVGRRVDCLGRDILAEESEDAVVALLRYLQQGKTRTARLLVTKAVVLLQPKCGSVVWPITSA